MLREFDKWALGAVASGEINTLGRNGPKCWIFVRDPGPYYHLWVGDSRTVPKSQRKLQTIKVLSCEGLSLAP